MPIILSVQTYRDAAPAQPLSRRFDRLGGALGRAAGNDLVLDDPSKYISRQHARIEYRDGGYCLVDVGSNPSLVNDRPVGAGRPMALADGDRITIGDYQLVASIDGEEPALPPSPLQVAPAPAPAFAPAYANQGFNPDDSLADASILNVGGDPFNPSFDPLGLNLLGTPSPPASVTPAWRGAESDHAPPEQAAFSAPPSFAPPQPVTAPPAPGLSIPDDYDPLADFLPPRVKAVPAPMPVPAPAPARSAEPPPPPPAAPRPAPAAVPAPPQPASRAASAVDDPVIQALLRGLGLTELNTKRSAEEIAEMAGAMLREATAGTMEVLMGRAMTKRESRLEVTMISAQANNPLKFFPDAHSALTQMLAGGLPGYMTAPRAFANAYDDLKAHELAMMAGMRAALAGVLARLDPAAVEARLEAPGVMDKVMASNRKARMWDRMVELYRDLAREADDDFHRLFGEAFGKAYEEQVQRLRQAQR